MLLVIHILYKSTEYKTKTFFCRKIMEAPSVVIIVLGCLLFGCIALAVFFYFFSSKDSSPKYYFQEMGQNDAPVYINFAPDVTRREYLDNIQKKLQSSAAMKRLLRTGS